MEVIKEQLKQYKVDCGVKGRYQWVIYSNLLRSCKENETKPEFS